MMIPRHNFLLAAAVLLCGGAASGPATQAASPKVVLEGMLRSVLSADEPAAMSALVFANADSRAFAEARLGRVAATARLRRAIIQRFDARGQDSPVGKQEEDNAREILSRLSAALVRMTGEGAAIAFDNGRTFYFVQRDGVWKVDFDKSQQGMGETPSKENLNATKKQTAAINALAGEVVAHRVAALEEIESRYNAIMAPPPATAPAPSTRR